MGIMWLSGLTGLLSAGVGIGGGCILVPSLITFFSVEYKKAAALSLATIMSITFIGAIFHFFRSPSMVPIVYTAYFLPFSLLGLYLGSFFTVRVRKLYILPFFGLFVLVVGLKMLQVMDVTGSLFQQLAVLFSAQNWLLIPFGLLIGFVSIVLGVGCGLVIVPFMVYVMGLTIHTAILFSLITMFFLSIMATIFNRKKAVIEKPVLPWLIFPAVLGAIIGSFVSAVLPAKILKSCFGVFLILMGSKFIVQNVIEIFIKRRDDAVYE